MGEMTTSLRSTPRTDTMTAVVAVPGSAFLKVLDPRRVVWSGLRKRLHDVTKIHRLAVYAGRFSFEASATGPFRRPQQVPAGITRARGGGQAGWQKPFIRGS